MRGPLGFTGISVGLDPHGSADAWLRAGAVYSRQESPALARRVRVVVRDTGGIDCEGATYLFAVARGNDCDVWVTHHGAGSVHLLEAGERTRAAEVLSARFRRGEELTLSATGTDAREVLEAWREMLEAHPARRQEMYRNLRKRS